MKELNFFEKSFEKLFFSSLQFWPKVVRQPRRKKKTEITKCIRALETKVEAEGTIVVEGHDGSL